MKLQGEHMKTTITGIAVLALCSLLQACATDPREVVSAEITTAGHWYMDGSDAIVYFDPTPDGRLMQLTLRPDLDWKSGMPARPLEFRLELASTADPDVDFRLSPRATRLFVGGEELRPSAVREGCSSDAKPTDLEIAVPKANARRPTPACAFVFFKASAPPDWSNMVLQLQGLTRDGGPIKVPEIRFRKGSRFFARCGSASAVENGMYCEQKTSYYDRKP
jgi:hypothetical protein